MVAFASTLYSQNPYFVTHSTTTRNDGDGNGSTLYVNSHSPRKKFSSCLFHHFNSNTLGRCVGVSVDVGFHG